MQGYCLTSLKNTALTPYMVKSFSNIVPLIQSSEISCYHLKAVDTRKFSKSSRPPHLLLGFHSWAEHKWIGENCTDCDDPGNLSYSTSHLQMQPTWICPQLLACVLGPKPGTGMWSSEAWCLIRILEKKLRRARINNVGYNREKQDGSIMNQGALITHRCK